jgi:hypothetical protein
MAFHGYHIMSIKRKRRNGRIETQQTARKNAMHCHDDLDMHARYLVHNCGGYEPVKRGCCTRSTLLPTCWWQAGRACSLTLAAQRWYCRSTQIPKGKQGSQKGGRQSSCYAHIAFFHSKWQGSRWNHLILSQWHRMIALHQIRSHFCKMAPLLTEFLF